MKVIKRAFDIVFSLLLLVLLSPVLVGISVLLYFTQGRPIFFVQDRVGKDTQASSVEELKCFRIYKFRTFRIDHIEAASRYADMDEVTKFGKFLRKTSVDELPQLVNILKGDMSFVGPRPLIPAERDIQELRFKEGVYAVKPGMTGLAQVNGRDDLDIEEKVKYDKEYVDNMSLGLDIKILFKTVTAVLTGQGTN